MVGAYEQTRPEVLAPARTYVLYGREPDTAVDRTGTVASQTLVGRGVRRQSWPGFGGDDACGAHGGQDKMFGSSGNDTRPAGAGKDLMSAGGGGCVPATWPQRTRRAARTQT